METNLEVQVVKGKKWHYLVCSVKNGQTILTSESYFSKWNARRAAKKIATLNNFGYREMK